jgi:serine/threonine-protein kinase ATR
VVCDAGGGTVDLISYKITQLSPKLQITEATAGTGDKCGSSLLNQRFRKHLKQRRGGDYWTDDRLVEAINTFETVQNDPGLQISSLIMDSTKNRSRPMESRYLSA